ncbi:hypothetical protein HMPREF1548_02297 [Clostridium sp. KLE 1755]|nr:hypothetical protein HMPREF1548_02297 [Clostridium sp. KLE 1755]
MLFFFQFISNHSFCIDNCTIVQLLYSYLLCYNVSTPFRAGSNRFFIQPPTYVMLL